MGDQTCSCRTPCGGTFRTIVKLPGSGLNVYVHGTELGNVPGWRNRETFIFHNTSNRDVKKDQFMADLGECSNKCNNCGKTIKKIQNLLLGLTSFARNEIVGACEYCGRKNANTCKKCSFIVKKFVANKINQYEAYKSNIREWLDKFRVTLSDEDTPEKIPTLPSTLEYQKILQDLERPAEGINTTTFPQAETSVNKNENKEVTVSPDAEKEVCCSKYLLSEKENNKYSDISQIVAHRKDEKLPVPATGNNNEVKNSLATLKEDANENVRLRNEKKLRSNGEKDIKREVNTKQLEMKTAKRDLNKNKSEHKSGAPKKVDSEEDLLIKMIKEKAMKKKTEKKVKEILKPLPMIDDLPIPIRKPKVVQLLEDNKSDSVVVCDPVPQDDDVIHGDNIVHRNNYKIKKIVKVPNANEKCLLHESRYECPNDIEPPSLPALVASPTPASTQDRKLEIKNRRGLRKYALSDRHFIEAGWTRLPIEKTMRQVNVYKMRPVNTSNWFIKNKGINAHFYVTGERFAQIDGDGSGKWFYRNGNVALEYFGSPDVFDSQRYCIYSSGNEGDRPVSMIAAFDYQGNAVVSDPHGKLRLKYNQNEGLVIDNTISIPGKWKWHTLNEPIQLKSVFLETSVDSKVFVPKETGRRLPREPDQLMTSIELEEKMKELRLNAQKSLTRFQIKKKVLKLNANFSLHIVDQTNVFLYFRCSTKSVKLNVGMDVVAEIVGTALVGLDDVSTPYDCHFT